MSLPNSVTGSGDQGATPIVPSGAASAMAAANQAVSAAGQPTPPAPRGGQVQTSSNMADPRGPTTGAISDSTDPRGDRGDASSGNNSARESNKID